MSDQINDRRAQRRQQRRRQNQIDAIIGQYTEAYRSGQAPRIEDYVERYPELASELLEFAVYYHTIGFATESLDGPPAAELSPAAEKALARIRERSAAYTQAPAAAVAPIESLFARGMDLKLAPPQLAATVGLTAPLLARLDARKIAVATIPRTLIQRLADALKTAPEVIAAYLGATQAGQAGAFYYADQPPTETQESFLDAVQASALTPEQKREWAEVVKTDAGANP